MGPPIPYANTQFIPQGRAYVVSPNSGVDWLVASLYVEGQQANKLVAVSRTTGQLIKTVGIAGSHAGGIAISNKFVWVSDPSGLYGYPLASFMSARDGTFLQADKFYSSTSRPPQVPNTSFVTFAEGYLWLGSFVDGAPGSLNSYTVDTNGTLRPVGTRAIPSQTQGIEFTPNYLIFSRSYGRANTSRITLENRRKAPPNQTHISAPGMPEETAYIPSLGLIYFNDESSALKFRRPPAWTGPVVNNFNYLPVNALLQLATS